MPHGDWQAAKIVLSQTVGPDGKPAVFTILDIAARPEAYAQRNIIKIKNVPIREDLQRLDFISAEEKDRIVRQGTVSFNFMFRPEVKQLLGDPDEQVREAAKVALRRLEAAS